MGGKEMRLFCVLVRSGDPRSCVHGWNAWKREARTCRWTCLRAIVLQIITECFSYCVNRRKGPLPVNRSWRLPSQSKFMSQSSKLAWIPGGVVPGDHDQLFLSDGVRLLLGLAAQRGERCQEGHRRTTTEKNYVIIQSVPCMSHNR